MRKKIFKFLNILYGVLMTASFFGGILPLPPFVFAIIYGGTVGEKISVFLYNNYYPWVIIIGSIALLFGLAAMYVGKLEGLSVKNITTDESSDESASK